MTDPDPAERQYECTLEIHAPRGVVWKALTNPLELTRWFAPEAEIDARVGGRVVWRWSEAIVWPQVIEVLETETRLRTRYDSSVEDGAGGRVPLYVEFVLEGEGGQTTLRMVHSGFGMEADFDAEYDGISRGWPVELRSLRHYVERHLGTERVIVSTIVDVVGMTAEEAWERIIGPAGLACANGIRGRNEGDAVTFTASTGERFEGTLLTNHPREFSARLESHGDAWLRACVENCGGTWQAWLWLGAYGLDEARRARTQATFDRVGSDVCGATR